MTVGQPPETRLASFAADPQRFLSTPNPMTQALWIALLDTPANVVARHMATMQTVLKQREMMAQGMTDTDEPDERPVRASVPGAPRTALQAIADAYVVKAMQGDAMASNLIGDRIEGRAGQRRGDVDPEEEARRAEVRQTIETLMRRMADDVLSERRTMVHARAVDVVDVAENVTPDSSH